MGNYEGQDPITPAELAVAAALRAHRNKAGLSLRQVEDGSGGTWKAVVVGSYERGDRRMSLGRFLGLCDFYGLPASELLPGAEDKALRARFLSEIADELNDRAARLRGDDEIVVVAVAADGEVAP